MFAEVQSCLQETSICLKEALVNRLVIFNLVLVFDEQKKRSLRARQKNIPKISRAVIDKEYRPLSAAVAPSQVVEASETKSRAASLTPQATTPWRTQV